MNRPTLGADVMPLRDHVRQWLTLRAETQAGRVPDLVSRDWLVLPDSHPLKVAAVCRAALGWTNYTDPDQIRRDLLDELEVTAWAHRHVLDQECAGIRKRIADGPTRAELNRLRGYAA